MLQLIVTCFFCFTSFFLTAFATLPPKITLSVPSGAAVEGRTIPLYISIIHTAKDTIDEASFLLEDQPYKVVFIQKETVSPEALFKGSEDEAVVVSRYRGDLPGKKAGLYTVGPLSVKVNAIRYESGSISIDVQGAVVSSALRLENIASETEIFPGQEAFFGYRIYFQKPLQLTREELPLLTISGFLNDGAPLVTTEDTSDGAVQTIIQKTRAQYPGTFPMKESVIEGFESQNINGEKRIVPPLYRAAANGVTITVLPFPEKGRPPVFDGAIGSFVWRASSLDGADVKVSKSVHIEYRVSGRGDLSLVKFPEYSQIPGLQDAFWTEGLPPVGEEVQGVKRFVLVVRPRRPGILKVPGFLMYSFDPVSKRYLTASVAPVALNVTGEEEVEQISREDFGHAYAQPYALTETSQTISMTIVFLVLFAALAIAILEVVICKKLRKAKKEVTTKKLFLAAITHRFHGDKGLLLLKEAFYRRLFEVGLTQVLEERPEALSDDGLVGEVKGYLQAVDRALYRGESVGNRAALFDEAIQLYQKLRNCQKIN